MKSTKIVCTLGPASQDADVLDAMIRAGMDVARLNFSHGSHEQHERTYRLVREAAKRCGREVGVLQDLPGPKIRVGFLPGGKLELTTGQDVVIQAGADRAEAGVIPTGFASLADDVSRDDVLLLDDGLIRLRARTVAGQQIECVVEAGGTLKDRKGINLPGVVLSIPAVTEQDLVDLDFGAELGVDFVCLSFVRNAAEVQVAKDRLRERGKDTPVIAKIEKPEAVEHLSAILDVADGIMVARGDLGVEMGPEKVPLIQKQAIEQANRNGKLVITATQMLESMVSSTFPTRAEASDVANAVLDQSDAVMLSAETAVGAHPALVVETMARIICEIEDSARYRQHAKLQPLPFEASSNAIARAAAAAGEALSDVKAIVCISTNGITPTLLSDYRPMRPIYALARRLEACHRLAAFWGVHPIHFEPHGSAEEAMVGAEALLVERGIVSQGDRILFTLAVPPGSIVDNNTLKIHRVGEETTKPNTN
ncbi:MAG: pyruvate kinase [Deltaproteobacteria bacterium]|nr:MAG: pyruvate kinase [Deltaproteobacteria bacterium]